MIVRADPESYSEEHRTMLRAHYLAAPPPGCLVCLAIREVGAGLFGVDVGVGPLLGVLLLGRPVARMLPQDGSWAEITRLYLAPGLPHGTASATIRRAFDVARARGVATVISYHDRERHTGCIYRKAGMRKDGGTEAPRHLGWASRPGRAQSVSSQSSPKRRWRIDFPNP